MTAGTVIEEIKQLPPAEQEEVIRFAIKLAGERPLTAGELNRLAQRMVDSNDLAEVERLKSAIASGFYGQNGHA